MEKEKEKFKKDFIRKLIRVSIKTLKLGEKMRKNRIFWPIIDQVVRSTTSIGANIVEAKASSSKKDYLRFFEIALKSANETKYWLILIKEASSEFTKETNALLREVDEISKIIGSSVLTLKGKK